MLLEALELSGCVGGATATGMAPASTGAGVWAGKASLFAAVDAGSCAAEGRRDPSFDGAAEAWKKVGVGAGVPLMCGGTTNSFCCGTTDGA